MLLAVIPLSPVIITTRTPAFVHCLMSSLTDSLGGSASPIKPQRVSVQSVIPAGISSSFTGFIIPTAITLRPCFDISITFASTSLRWVSFILQIVRILSGEPFAAMMISSSCFHTCPIIFNSLVKAYSVINEPLKRCSSAIPNLSQWTSIAFSIGSYASVSHASPIVSHSFILSLSIAQVSRTVIWFIVIVPVLSTQSTETAPKVSTDGKRRTRDFCLASLHAPIERNTVNITGNSSGIIAMASVIPERMLSINRSLFVWSGILSQVTNPTAANKTAAIPAHSLTRLPVCFCRGVGDSGAEATFAPIFPYSVEVPILSTNTYALPCVTNVPA
ncbi:hypothetical protein SDC9_140090 [bioreactor metagenome]|uniref:Uncharacterized protein n=1 Tax=bioreactor metagenome TaxID=1076179 RepID=A0A645DTW6_9ZZZZ